MCGCGVEEKDTDGDGTPDCIDECSEDKAKIEKGVCGCGTLDIDTDKDGTADCIDFCSEDKNKQKPGVCGCGVADLDSDGDKKYDCEDKCPEDKDKIEVGVCGCGVSDVDTDKDGTADCIDECPNDPSKKEKGVCGCGVSDKDSDNDGVLNCKDECPRDKLKTKAGACGCGAEDLDTDNDGEYDCKDDCPSDPLKNLIGICGCNIADTDSDSDGEADCKDECDNDPNKKVEGICGCGVSDVDTDKDGVPDCNDSCKTDPNKQSPGVCGCNVSDIDTDKDGVSDCNDSCKTDPDKQSQGACGCGVADTDTDKDGIPDCKDSCPNDKDKISQGICGCGIPDTDTDNDGIPDCNDKCPNNANKEEAGVCGCEASDADNDRDGVLNCEDLCPEDPNKQEAGVCGCGIEDLDTDGDGVFDCEDLCIEDPKKEEPGICGCGIEDLDTDKDGRVDCQDACPEDPLKIEEGICGCGIEDLDTDNDGVLDCRDSCKEDPNKEEPKICGCGIEDLDTDEDGTPDCIDPCPEDKECSDTDKDGILDYEEEEDTDGDKVADYLEHNEADTDKDGILNFEDFDDDNDEIPTAEECPSLPCRDVDKDGIPDYLEANNLDTDGDGNPDVADEDDDNDGVLTKEECKEKESYLLCIDTDKDGIPEHLDKNTDFNKNDIPDTEECETGYPCEDTDKDLTPDYSDGCPEDENKLEAGVCGCGTPETDTDNDGTPDCVDECQDDSSKTEAGVCGCGTQDTDTDSDGRPDCSDQCPNDPSKTAAGTCGCGTPDTDSDGDSIPDCNDQCVSDPLKSIQGVCGCGVSDSDTDGDGALDCQDRCPNDPNKRAPLSCGCGTEDVDTDGDGTLDCNDNCPQDPNKTEGLICGCGTPDIDTDNDGVLDCNDSCPRDPEKQEAGICGCGTPDTDRDGDGTPDCQDQCPDDANKTEPENCGCGQEELQNSEGEFICRDMCPEDPEKVEPGVCGCGEPELDGNDDGIIDCGADQTADSAANDSVFKREAVYMAEVELAKGMEEAFGEMAATFNMEAEDHILEKDTEFNFLADVNCIAENSIDPFFGSQISDEEREKSQRLLGKTLAVEVFTGKLKEDIKLKELRDQVNKEKCVDGIVDVPEVNVNNIVLESFNDPQYENQNHLEDINFEDSYQYFNTEGKDRVTVAVIDTGYDYDNPDGTVFAEILQGSNLMEQIRPIGEDPNRAPDDIGHGTAVASIIAAAQNNNDRTVGIAAKQVRILPIKIFRRNAEPADLLTAVRYAVNAGAKIINLSLGAASTIYCDPGMGQMIYRAIEKGVFFVVSAGNGILDKNGVAYPIELKGPTDDGPQDFGKTASPACWGEYFKGVVTVAATETGTKKFASFSNYGHPVEMIAPGTAIVANGPAGTIASGSGTSFSAPQVTAAAALIMSVAKTNDWYISPWLLEDMLLNGSPVDEELRKETNEGKYLDLKTLSEYVSELKAMTPEERRRIPSKNQRVGDGWDPENDIERVDKLVISAETTTVEVGDSLQLKAYLSYKDGTTRDVTNEPRIHWSAQYQPLGKTSVSRSGFFNFNSPIGADSIRIISIYKDYEAELYLDVPEIGDSNEEEVFEGISIKALSEVYWGEQLVVKVEAEYKKGEKGFSRDVTGFADLSSNQTSELELSSELTGVFITRNAYGGRTYTITANFRGKTVTHTVKIKKRNFQLKIRNALGNAYKGQNVILRSVLESATHQIDIPTFSNWSTSSEAIRLPVHKESEVLIPTDNLDLGTYTVSSRVNYRGNGSDEELSVSYTFDVEDNYDRLSLITKTPIINYVDRAVFSLRFFSSNNSYTVINPNRINWSTSDPALPIDNQGIVYPTRASLDDTNGKTYTVYAEYLGSKVSARIRIVPVSVISGQAAKISHISIRVADGYDKRMCAHEVEDDINCNKILLSGARRSSKFEAYAYYTNGNIRDVTKYVSWVSSNPVKLNVAPLGYGGVGLRSAARPYENYFVYALYEGYVGEFPIGTLRTEKVEFRSFHMQDIKEGSAGVNFKDGELGVLSNWKTRSVSTDRYPRRHIEVKVYIEDERGLSIHSGGPRSKGFRVTSSHGKDVLSENGTINFTLVEPEEVISFDYEEEYDYYGFPVSLKNNASVMFEDPAPEALHISPFGPDYSVWRKSATLEGWQHHLCKLKYPGQRARLIDSKDVAIKLRYENSDEEVKGVGYQYAFNNIKYFPFKKQLIGKTVIAELTHKEFTNLKAYFKMEIQGKEEIDDFNFNKKPIPSKNFQLKAKDPYCTKEKMELLPYAGGRDIKSEPILICSADQLFSLQVCRYRNKNGSGSNGKRCAQHVKLLNNIDFSKYREMSFLGGIYNLDGNGYAISNYQIIDRELSYFGLFEFLENVKDLIIINPNVRGENQVGGLAGYIRNAQNIIIQGGQVWGSSKVGMLTGMLIGSIDQILVDNVKVDFEKTQAGCIAGLAKNKKIENVLCNANINFVGVQGNSRYVGGIIGKADYGDANANKIYMFNTSFEGEINAGLRVAGKPNDPRNGSSRVGGLIGEASRGLAIIDSHSSAKITSIGSEVGGLIGSATYCSRYDYRCLIYKSSFNGHLIGGSSTTGASSTGGLVGYSEGGMIVDSHVKKEAIIRGIEGIGGLIGTQKDGRHRILNSSVQAEITSSTETHGGVIGSIEDYPYEFDNYEEDVILENIYDNNTWKNLDRYSIGDIGLWHRTDEVLRNVDVSGVDEVQ